MRNQANAASWLPWANRRLWSASQEPRGGCRGTFFFSPLIHLLYIWYPPPQKPMLLGCLALLVLVVIENETNIFLFWYILTENMLGTMQFVATARFPYHNGFKIQEIALRLKRHFLNPSVFALFRSTFAFQRDNACQHDTFFMSNTWEASGLVIISPLAKNTFLKGGMKKNPGVKLCWWSDCICIALK